MAVFCKDCEKKKLIDEFRVYTFRGVQYRKRQCIECERAARRTPEARAQARVRRQRYVERRRADGTLSEITRRANQSAQHKRAKQKYERSPKGKAAAQRYRDKRRSAREALAARDRMAMRQMERESQPFPMSAMEPYLKRIRAYMDANYDEPNLTLSEWTGESTSRISDYLRCKQKTVDQGFMDLLSVHFDFTLEELVEHTKEWALLSGNKWPS